MAIPMRLLGRRQRGERFLQRQFGGHGGGFLHRFRLRFSSQRLFRTIIISLVFIAVVPPIFFHFRLRNFHQMQQRKCGWLNDPPLVCAHGGDSTKAFPNTMAAYRIALGSHVDCIEIDVSRSSDGVLFALHDRDLQRISGNSTSKVGHLSMKEIKELGSAHQSVEKFHDERIPTIEDALTVGYIVMKDPSTGARTKLLRMKSAGVVGVYHPLVDEKLVKILHGRNKEVYAWTVDDVDSMQKMLFERVDAVVTSNPTLLQRLMQDTRTQCLEEGFTMSQ
ncbi:glycerophosphodiester phosphodiesterase GDPD4 isoform X3 [Corylus avellana]|uniref:glycerophosphodiester phosphodiesterase GDPD4 isoform X3 n=1 Tax=Corylus avellana TaxID=13451 RepID=UPI00286A5F10|nr:glycerophosphodiester phosphodiesterase GDPD4 isoform X3 [Corylus avellana]